MKQYLKDFYEAFNIKQTLKGYWSSFFDGFPAITSTTVLELEEMLLDMDKDCHLEIYKEFNEDTNERLYQYIVIENDYDNPDEHYHHGFCIEPSKTREEALINYLTSYAHVSDVYEGVRKVLKVE